MCQPAFSNSAMVASCKLPLGIPSFNLFAKTRPRAQGDVSGEATHRALVAHQSVSLDGNSKQHRILIAVGSDGLHPQAISAGLALHPQLLPRPAPERHKTCFQSFGVAGFV